MNIKGRSKWAGMLTVIIALTVIPGMAQATVPEMINYQGYLTDASGALNSAVTITFSIWDAEENGNLIWEEEKANITVSNGVFNVVLGESNPITGNELNEDEHYLQLTVNGTDLTPRYELTSTIFAIRAKYADAMSEGSKISTTNIEDNAVTTSKIKDDAVTTEKIASEQVEYTELGVGAVTNDRYKTTIKTYNSNQTLGQKDQGLILVSGNTTVTLPAPVTDTKGWYYKIKKIDDGYYRQCDKSCACVSFSPRNGTYSTNIVTLKEGGGLGTIESKESIRLRRLYAYVAFISDGSKWYIVDSNPLIDIINPVPGRCGQVTKSEFNEGNPAITVSWEAGYDPDIDWLYWGMTSQCDRTLEYRIYVAKKDPDNNGSKLLTLSDINEYGVPATDWLSSDEVPGLEGAYNLNLEDAFDDALATGKAFSYSEPFNVNVVIRDESGNKTPYCTPGDQLNPDIKNPIITLSRITTGVVDISWFEAIDDEADSQGASITELQYAVFYADEEELLVNLAPAGADGVTKVVNWTSRIGPPPGTQTVVDDQLRYEYLSSAKLVIRMEDLPSGIETYFTVLVRDLEGNWNQYNIMPTTPY